MDNKNSKHTSFDKELLEEAKSETFDSAFYFDDIIKELSDAGFYSEDDDLKSEAEDSLVVSNVANDDKKKSLELDNKESEEVQSINDLLPPRESDELKTVVPTEVNHADHTSKEAKEEPKVKLDKNVVKKIFDIENRILKTNNNLKAELANVKEFLAKQTADQNVTLQRLESSLLLSKNNTEHNLEKLNNSFEKRIANDTAKDKAIDKLYEQLENYKTNFIHSALKPFVKDLILFYDRIENNLKALQKEEKDSKLIETISLFKEELLEIFDRNSILPVEKSEIGSRFNPEISKVGSKEETDDESKDLTIKDVLIEGFSQDGKIIRPELVAIYKYK